MRTLIYGIFSLLSMATSFGITAGLAGAVQTQNGNTYRNISASITGLIANRTYHFRIKGSNANGTTFGADGTFTTQ